MSVKEYLDFDLLIDRIDDQYTARVLFSPAGEAKRTFSLPFSQLELDNIMLRLGQPRRGVRRVDTPEVQTAKDFGGRLYKAIFDDAVQACLLNSRDAATTQGNGLRIRLRLDAPDLAGLPWEYLYYSVKDEFLVQSTDTSIVRYIDIPEKIRPLGVTPPLNILVMISSPRDYEPLDVEQEWANISGAMQDLVDQGKVAIDRLETASLKALRQQLKKKDYHIFHYVGHGAFDKKADDGILVFENESEHGTQVSGQDLGVVLMGHKALRLAVINACEGARTSSSDPFSGVAQSLIRKGIPTVIAMQFEVTDKTAIVFAHEFYSSLLNGAPVDAALSDARLAIFTDVKNIEWGTPVLFMRSPDGKVFNITSTQEMIIPKTVPPQEPESTPPERSTTTQPPLDVPSLVVKKGPLAGRTIPLKGLSFIIGREHSSQVKDRPIVIPDSQISRQHALIWYEGGKFHIKDLDSKNGTKVNDIKIVGRHILNNGDVIHVGESLIIFQQVTASTGSVFETTSDDTGSFPPQPERMRPSIVETPKPKPPPSHENVRIQITRLYAQAEAARLQKNWDLAIDSLMAILELDKNQPRAHQELDYAERKKKCLGVYRDVQSAKTRQDWAEAIELLQIILDTEPDPPIIRALKDEMAMLVKNQQIHQLFDLAQEAKNQQDWPKAIGYLEEIRKIDPKYMPAISELNQLRQFQRNTLTEKLYADAQSAMQAGNYLLAMNTLQELLKIQPDHSRAKIDFNEVRLHLDQERVTELHTAAQSAISLGNYSQAITHYQAILRIQPNNASVKYELEQAQKQHKIITLYADAQTAMTQGNWKTASEKLETLLRIDPTLEDAREALTYAQHNLKTQNAELLYNQGQVHYRANRFRQALDCFYKVKGLVEGYKDSEDMIRTIESIIGGQKPPVPIQSLPEKPYVVSTPDAQPWAACEGTGRKYEIIGFDADTLVDQINQYFLSNGYETQIIHQDLNIMVQGKKLGLRRLVGMGLATSVIIETTAIGAQISIGGGKWAEQGAAIAVGLYLWPLLVTGGVGMLQQKELVDTLWRLVEQHIFERGGRRML